MNGLYPAENCLLLKDLIKTGMQEFSWDKQDYSISKNYDYVAPIQLNISWVDFLAVLLGDF